MVPMDEKMGNIKFQATDLCIPIPNQQRHSHQALVVGKSPGHDRNNSLVHMASFIALNLTCHVYMDKTTTNITVTTTTMMHYAAHMTLYKGSSSIQVNSNSQIDSLKSYPLIFLTPKSQIKILVG